MACASPRGASMNMPAELALHLTTQWSLRTLGYFVTVKGRILALFGLT